MAGASDCSTAKEKVRGGRARCVGLLASSFTGCGVVGFLREVIVAESLAFAVHAVSELAVANPHLQTLGYDDGCHLAEALRRHPDRRLQHLDVWIDLFHLFGHVRTKCFLEHNPLTRLSAADMYTVQVHSDALRRRLLQHVDPMGKVVRPRTLQARLGCLWGPGRSARSMRLLSVGARSCAQACHTLGQLAAAALPVTVEVKSFAHVRPLTVTLASTRDRARFLGAINILSGRLQKVIHMNKVPLPKHSVLVAWWRPTDSEPEKHVVASAMTLVEALRTETVPFSVVFVYGQNTPVAEQNWVHFNKFRHTLRNLSRGEYLLFAHRIAHLRNWERLGASD